MFSGDAYNKSCQAGKDVSGTLIANWGEERVLREALGEGRSVPQRHIPRSGLLKDFTKTPAVYRQCDDTFGRVYGKRSTMEVEPASKTIGKHDEVATVGTAEGPLEQLMRTTRATFAEQEVAAEEDVVAQQAKVRHLDTSTATFHAKPNSLEVEKAEHCRKTCKDEINRGPPAERTQVVGSHELDVQTHAHYSNVETVTYVGLKGSSPVQSMGGPDLRGPFCEVPSLAALKVIINGHVKEALGPYGYIALRVRLAEIGDEEGFVRKAEVLKMFRDVLGLKEQEVPTLALETYLDQLATMKSCELRIGSLVASLRPSLSQADKRRALEKFAAMSVEGAAVKLEDLLGQLDDQDLKNLITKTFTGSKQGEQDQAACGKILTDQVFLDLCTDVGALTDLSALAVP